jgi:NADH-quinone oxidoreductase subunit M
MTLLSSILLLPLLSSLVILLLKDEKTIKYTSVIFSVITFIASIFLYTSFDLEATGFQFETQYNWINVFGSTIHIGIDGISLILVLLTTFLMPIVLLTSFSSITKKIKQYYSLMMLLEFAVLGVFISMDLLLFYIFWELILIPMYFVIGIWGGKDRIYATVKFFIFTLFGSLLMLVGLVWLSSYVGSEILHTSSGFTTDLIAISEVANQIPYDLQNTLFWLFAISFLIKVPVFPLHTWLPDAHTEAPTPGSVILAGVLLKMGTYGLIRFNLDLFPAASANYADTMATLAVIGIIYGGIAAMIQKDMKRLVAYSSVAHMGFIVLGIFSFTHEGMQGAIIQMVNHGLSTGLLFICVGFLYEQTHTREISKYGGFARIVPKFAVVFALAMFASVGLPGLNGFVGEFYTLLGAFTSEIFTTKAFAIIGASGVIVAAIYLLLMYKGVMFGQYSNTTDHTIKDLNTKYWIIVLPLLLFIFWIGVYPKPFFEISDKSVETNLIKIEKCLTK